ncbi:uroporphyrinogen-III C-methyltransferase [Shewanella sp. KX20019]|uniref:uroporphyrinogen-III C-methyltransferase n=1 Tax=Shewanella sp. KX20019 TaxID=2803864 RepID=UPI0019279F26|nr:uroporphyrinogen-III C-methyltransferase [Shewanella sp. KX20019]QQX82090.1 uroporphyrinogen-III C-methyltransferase [Shewanella sp. KX20019]
MKLNQIASIKPLMAEGVMPMLQRVNDSIRADEANLVTIVGAGCGDIDMLTIKAARAIASAEAIVYDNLVSKDILQLASEGCEMHYMGKCFAKPSATQEQINQKLLQLSQQGKAVTRLKGGDPNVFGRGSEEAIFLAKNGVKSQFVAGVTAALGCAASAGIPLTHRKVARSVTFVTGHLCDDTVIEWAGLLAARSTMVFYMGKERAAEIAHGLLQAGAKLSLPVAFISNGARDNQSIVSTSVQDMADVATSINVDGPTLLIVGEVVGIGQELSLLLLACDIKSDSESDAECDVSERAYG